MAVKFNARQAKVFTKLVQDVPNHTVWVFPQYADDYLDVEFETNESVTVRKYRIFEDGRSEIRPLDSDIREEEDDDD